MKFRIVAVVAATAALSFAAAGSASAQPFEPAGQHGPAQVTGSQLKTAVLPASAFGSDFTFSQSADSGSKLKSTRAKYHVPAMSCFDFEHGVYISKFGDTAGVVTQYTNPHWIPEYPNTIVAVDEMVLQFATAATASTFYSQVRAKYAGCPSGAEPFFEAPADTLSVTKTTVNGDQAFLVIQDADVSPGIVRYALYALYLYVVAGTNVYDVSEFSGTNDEPSVPLVIDLIHRVQALYPHHK